MQSIEFKTILHNGIVNLPLEYSSQWEGKTIRVILLDEAELDGVAEANLPKNNVVTHKGNLPCVDQPEASSSLFSRLRQIKISAPPDFSENLDTYLNGEKSV
jgi:hypothetical protein